MLESKGMLLALAPGLRQTGWAVFDGASVAVAARLGVCLKCRGDLVNDEGDWLCLQCGVYYYTGLYPLGQSPAEGRGGLLTVGAAGFAAPPAPAAAPPAPGRPGVRLAVAASGNAATPFHSPRQIGKEREGKLESKGMLLALAPGLRQTGWAVFDGASVAAGGVAAPKNPRKLDTADRIARQLEAIAAVAARWPADAGGRRRPLGRLPQVPRRPG